VYTCTRSVYTAVYTTNTRSCTRRLQAMYTVVFKCSWPVFTVRTRVHGPYTYKAVYTGRVRTAMHTCTRPIHGHVYTAEFTTRTRPCNGRTRHVKAVGPVHGRYTAVNTACIRPCTRIHVLYTKPIKFATFSQNCDYIRKQSISPYCLSPEVHFISFHYNVHQQPNNRIQSYRPIDNI